VALARVGSDSIVPFGCPGKVWLSSRAGRAGQRPAPTRFGHHTISSRQHFRDDSLYVNLSRVQKWNTRGLDSGQFVILEK
jgi:hypothetical protein